MTTINTDNLKSKLDIVEVINSRVPLKRSGANHMACCPFHGEKTPSFSVSQSKQFYHCFGCGAGGDVIEFIMNYDHVDFLDAVKILGGEDIESGYEPTVIAQWKIEKQEREAESKKNYAARVLREHIDDMHIADPRPMIDYLATRGIKNIPFSDDIGFLARCQYDRNEYYPAIFSIIRDRFGNIVAGHRGYLDCDKKPNRKKLASIVDGAGIGGAVRAISSTSKTLILAEGLETLLSVYMLNGGRDANYWSTVDANGMQNLSIPAEFDTIEIYSDLDVSKTGQKASKALSDRYDCKVFYAAKEVPEGKKGFDFNDLLKNKLNIS